MEEARPPARAVRNELAAELSRRELLGRATTLGLGALVIGALPTAARMATPAAARASGPPADPDGTLQAFYDTLIPGVKVPGLKTELRHPIHPHAIIGADPEHGAVYTDALQLGKNPKLGFELLAPAFLSELESRALAQGAVADGALFLSLDYDHRQAVCMGGLAFSNPTRVVWEAAAAVAFTAFCAAATIRNADGRPGAKRNRAAGYRVMGHPGIAPHGYRDFSYGRRLARGRTTGGSLP
ncbi:MAG: DUF5987 family protein [Solirubrobacterales bacterium]